MQREIMRAEVERHPDQLAGELLRGEHLGVRPHRDRGIADDGAPADLAAADLGVLDAAVVAPFAGVVEVGLALLEHLAVARERIEALRAVHIGSRALVFALALDPLDGQAFLREQAFFVGDQFRQSLERRGGFEDELFHGEAPCDRRSENSISGSDRAAYHLSPDRGELRHGYGAAAADCIERQLHRRPLPLGSG
jgi:hypothetical protein